MTIIKNPATDQELNSHNSGSLCEPQSKQDRSNLSLCG